MNSHSVLALLLLCGIAFPALARPSSNDSSFILLVVPESDTTTTSSSAYRLSASTNPGSKVTVNERPFRVYPSGAFVGLLDLQVGENPFTIVSTRDSNNSTSKTFIIVRSEPLASTRADTLVIEDVMMEPASDMWLGDGDILEVQIMGTPNFVATFLNGIVMHEVPRSEARGLEGVYRGTYKVTSIDTLVNQPLIFRLEDKNGHVVVKKSRGKISFKARDFPLVGVTKGERVYLDFGLSDDRLGGAKLAFIQEGIRLIITGKAGNRYRLRLTESHEAWIPEDQVELQPGGTHLPSTLTGNWSVTGRDKYDEVTVSLGERLPYSSFTESDPTRINIDVYGAVSNSNWITQQLSTKEIKNAYYSQVSKQQFRITLELNHRQVWGYQVSYKGKSLVVKVKRQPERLKLKDLTVVVDAGHGGDNNGALGCTGVKEKDVTLAIVQHMKEVLEKKGAHVILTRSDDANLTMIERLKRIWSSDADILVSIHANSIGLTTNPEDTKGAATFYKHVCFRPLSLSILEQVLKTGLTSFGNVGSFNFTLNSLTELPNVLVETAFISHPEDEMKLLDDDFRSELAGRIVDGLQEFLDGCDE
jgi:N-acetylmuramoyl-L-alanine amidase